MLIRNRRGWELPESAATPEQVFRERRRLLRNLAAGSIAAAMPLAACSPGEEETADAAAPVPTLAPAPRNPAYTIDRALTPKDVAGTYNNFYEYGSSKNIWQEAQRLRARPWEIVIDGLVEREFVIGIDDLLARVEMEERVYRHRCVEAWSMTVAWTGFPMRSLVEMAAPLASAKYVRMETFHDREMAPGQRQFWYPWPYVEGVTIAEAVNELSFLVTGAYGETLPKQHGAPLRAAFPWKYGFKHGKSLVRFSFVEEQPLNFWQELQGREYGFWANVHPGVPHPRWGQDSERVLGTGQRVATQLFNGYTEFVADLYRGMEDQPIWF